jgi:TM2 domain-containing membrane protein YozV
MANRVLKHLPEIDGDEQMYVAQLMASMSDEQVEQFARIYRTRRRDETTVLMLTLLGFVLVAGVQRFYVDQLGMGILYLATAGFCGIGTLIDLVRYKKITLEYNRNEADQVAAIVKGAFPDAEE